MAIDVRKRSKRAYLILGSVVVLGLASYLGYDLVMGDRATTDNAQLESDVVPIGTRVGGMVRTLHVVDNQSVKKGDLLAELDPTDYEVRVAQAEADLEAAVAGADSQAQAGGKDGAGPSFAQVSAAKAALVRAKAEERKAVADLARARQLRGANAIAAVELETALNTVERMRAAADQAEAQLELAEEQHGVADAKVKAARAALTQAETMLGYTRIVAPRDGTLSKLAVQEGQIVQPGQTLVQLVGDDAFVVANFKETQIGRMQPGQRAEITVDAYPGRRFEGRVESLSAATGARFSLLPPDNASGNFVKVVQRVAVKIALDAPSPRGVDLRAGLSAGVTVRLE
jgi:membrane fusion protein (multidrug efflux system)